MNKNFTLLLAEDNADDFAFFCMTLYPKFPGINIHRVENAVRLNCMLPLVTPDVVFIDLNMPLQNGIDCVKALRQKEEYKDLFIIVYSTSASALDVEKSYMAGANLYMKKPFSFSEMDLAFDSLFTNVFFLQRKKAPLEKFLLN
jgi:CheY-like chemotaxis protein